MNDRIKEFKDKFYLYTWKRSHGIVGGEEYGDLLAMYTTALEEYENLANLVRETIEDSYISDDWFKYVVIGSTFERLANAVK